MTATGWCRRTSDRTGLFSPTTGTGECSAPLHHVRERHRPGPEPGRPSSAQHPGWRPRSGCPDGTAAVPPGGKAGAPILKLWRRDASMASVGPSADQSECCRGPRKQLVPAARTTEHVRLAHETGGEAHGEPVLVAQGIRPDGKQEVIDSTQAAKPVDCSPLGRVLSSICTAEGLGAGNSRLHAALEMIDADRSHGPFVARYSQSMPAPHVAAPLGAQDQKYPRQGPTRLAVTLHKQVSTPP